MGAKLSLLLIAVLLSSYGCSATLPVAQFSKMTPMERSPGVFKSITNRPGQVDAKISLRAPGLKGSAKGVVRHAQGDQYLIELYGRGELFLKVYFTGKQTILWPASGMPEFFDNNEIPTLKTSVHQLLPDWRLDDVLPVPHAQIDTYAITEWMANSHDECAQKIEREGFETVYKVYTKQADDPCFPYRVVSLGDATGTSRLTWSLSPSRKNSH